MTRLAALVLAGGRASRMGGGDKPLLDLAGRSMMARILDTLAAETRLVAISANGDPARFAAFARPVLADGAFAGRGPLAGLLAGLEWARARGATDLLTVPGDTPFIPAGLAARLAPAPACAASAGRAHHLVALWPATAAAALRRVLAVSGSHPGSLSVARFASSIGCKTVVFASDPWDPFMNVNTGADLAAARAILGDMP